MKLFDVYPLFDITPVKAQGSWLWDSKGEKYLDLYGGHAVICIGHSHPHYVSRLTEQLNKIAFYSNSVQNDLQVEFADKLGRISGYPDYQLFLCNSGAEANENALKLASFHNGRKKVVAFHKAFHGRTSLAVAATDNPAIVAPVNQTDNIDFLPFNDEATLKELDTLAHTITNHVEEAGDEERLKLHLAAVFCNNFVNHLYVLMEDYCRQEHISFNLLKPLIAETALRIETISPADAQTGPAVRNDTNTIEKHLHMLERAAQNGVSLIVQVFVAEAAAEDRIEEGIGVGLSERASHERCDDLAQVHRVALSGSAGAPGRLRCRYPGAPTAPRRGARPTG